MAVDRVKHVIVQSAGTLKSVSYKSVYINDSPRATPPPLPRSHRRCTTTTSLSPSADGNRRGNLGVPDKEGGEEGEEEGEECIRTRLQRAQYTHHVQHTVQHIQYRAHSLLFSTAVRTTTRLPGTERRREYQGSTREKPTHAVRLLLRPKRVAVKIRWRILHLLHLLHLLHRTTCPSRPSRPFFLRLPPLSPHAAAAPSAPQPWARSAAPGADRTK